MDQEAVLASARNGGTAKLEAAVSFCCLEALQNAAKHAGDDARATVRVTKSDGALHFEVVDQGRGFDLSTATLSSSGLQNMTDRIVALGGQLRIDSVPGDGTTVSGTVPISADT
jgi:signal transduction histidine kinase